MHNVLFMKILLAGEYSRLHNSLKEGLLRLGHTVHLVSGGDFFKNFPSDFSVKPVFSEKKSVIPFRKAVYRFTKFDFARLETAIRVKKILPQLKNYDIVQLINIYPFETPVKTEQKILETLFKQNKKSFLLACGDDYHTNRYYLDGKMRYSVLTPLLENPGLKNQYQYSLKYVTPAFKQLQAFVEQHVSGIIPSDLDYDIPYRNHPLKLPMIPNPVNTEKIQYHFPPVKDKIVIFHGINSWNVLKKGNEFFSQALEQIRQKYGSRVDIREVKDLPYQDYVRERKNAHIVLDMVLSFDQGYNALEAMAEGKVVFTGAEKEFHEYYRLTEPVCVNALPSVDYLVEKLSELIENPEIQVKISENARKFIEREHHYVKIAQRYLDTWQNT